MPTSGQAPLTKIVFPTCELQPDMQSSVDHKVAHYGAVSGAPGSLFQNALWFMTHSIGPGMI